MFAALAQGAARPWNPRCPPPCTARLYAFRRPPAGALAEGQGCRGRAPPTPCRQAWVARSRQAVSSPGGCGPHQPLDPPSTRKTRQRPAQGLEGHCRRDGVKARAATAQRLGLDAQERPQRSGLVAGGALPPAACHVANAPGGPPEALLICSCFALCFGETPKRAFCSKDSLWLWFLSTANGVCVSAPLLHFRGLVRRHPVGASRGFTR